MAFAEARSFGTLLRRYRVAAGMTQEELAASAGLGVRTISDLERGVSRRAHRETVARLADVLRLEEQDRAALEAAVRTERVRHQVTNDPAADLLPVVALDANLTNLPNQLTSFVGRELELAKVRHLLREHRLVTLTGSGGCGKTRLALQAADGILQSFADGVWLVDLAPRSEPDLVPQAVVAALGAREEPGRDLVATLVEYLRPKHLLLVLDNCEHVLGASAGLVGTLLHACPQLSVLATSREALCIAGEMPFRVPSLRLPDPGDTVSVEVLAQSEAVRLLVERAAVAQPTFALTEQNAPAVVQICRRLDGIPLALELAAARLRALTVEQVAQRLDDQFHLLTRGSRTGLPRQQTLRALIDWSYDLLSSEERVVLRRLSVFAGGWTLEAAEAICSGDGVERRAVLDLLTGLVDKSLVLVEVQQAAARYRLLETVRQYAREKLLEADKEESVCNRHLAWVTDQVEAALAREWSPRQFLPGTVMAAEFDNLRVALEWSRRAASGEAELRLAGAMYFLWNSQNALTEGRQAVAMALARSDPSMRSSARARALFVAGMLAGIQGDVGAVVGGAREQIEESVAIYRELGRKHEVALALLALGRSTRLRGDDATADAIQAECVALFRETGDRWGLAMALFLWGDAAMEAGDYAGARTLLEESLALFRALDDRPLTTNPLISLARVACAAGNYVTARALAEEGLAIRRELGNTWLVAIALVSLGEVERCAGEHTVASAHFQAALPLLRRANDPHGTAWVLCNLGHAALQAGDRPRAATLFSQSLALYTQHNNQAGIASCLAGMAGIALRAGQTERATMLFGAVEARLASAYVVLAPADALAHDRDVAQLRAQCTEDMFASAWAQGRALALEHVIAAAEHQ